MKKFWQRIQPAISPGIRVKLTLFTLLFVSALLAFSFMYSYVQQSSALSASFRKEIETPIKLVEEHVTDVYRLAEGFAQLEIFRKNYEKQKRELAKFRKVVAVKADSLANRLRGVVKIFGRVNYTYQMRAFDTYYSTYLTDKNLKDFESKVQSALEGSLQARVSPAVFARLKMLARGVADGEAALDELSESEKSDAEYDKSSARIRGRIQEARRKLLAELRSLFRNLFDARLQRNQFAADNIRILSYDTELREPKSKGTTANFHDKEPVRLFDTDQAAAKQRDRSEKLFANAEFQRFFENFYKNQKAILARAEAPSTGKRFWNWLKSVFSREKSAGHVDLTVANTPFEASFSPIFSNFPVVERARRILIAEESGSESELLAQFAQADEKFAAELKAIGEQKRTRFQVIREKGIPPYRDPEFMQYATEYKKTAEKRDAALAKILNYANREAKFKEELNGQIKDGKKKIAEAEKEIARLKDLRAKILKKIAPKDAPTQESVEADIELREQASSDMARTVAKIQSRLSSISDNNLLVVCEALLSLRDASLLAKVRLSLRPDEDYLQQTWASADLRREQTQSFAVLRKFIYDSKNETDMNVPRGARSPLEGGVLAMTRSDAEFEMHRIDAMPILGKKGLAQERFDDYVVGFNLAIVNKSEGLARIIASTRTLILFLSVIAVLAIFAAWYFSGFAVRRLASLSQTAGEVRDGKLQVHFDGHGFDELATLGQSLNGMVEGLKEREELKGEMAAAEEIQKRLLPASVPANLAGRADLAGFYKAMVGIGGDYFDYVALGQDHIAIAMGDVSSHGVGPALVMAITRSQLHAQLREKEISLKNILLKLNAQLYAETPAHMFVTFFLGLYNLKTGELQYISAGHSKPLFYSAASGKTSYLDAGGMPLGMDDNDFFADTMELRKVTLKEGDIFLQYTDGLSEAMNSAREQFGYERMEQVLAASANENAEKELLALVGAVESFAETKLDQPGPSALSDDIALLCLKRI